MQKRLAEMLFIKKFNKLFFSWSWNIRTVYHKLYLYQLQHVFGKGLENDTPDESQSKRVKRSKSSANFRFVKLELIAKNMTGNKTTNKQSLYEDENRRIKELVQIAHNRQHIIDEYVKEYQVDEKLDYREYVDDTSDEEDSENNSIHESKIVHLIKEIPDKYKHYVNDSIKDFLEEQKLYNKWEKGEKDEEQGDGLPEIELQAVLDESENPDVDLDGNDGW